jgi:WD40 repeat protein
LHLWDTATGQLIRAFEGHSGAVRAVAFSPDGTLVLSGSYDNTVKLWDAATGEMLRSF